MIPYRSVKTVNYTSPAHGGWGIVRLGMLVPESYQLFVCPFACGRHGAIGAIEQGLKDRLSYLYIDESDIVSGNYENLVIEAVDELLSILDKTPKVLMIVVSCIDDLLGTDLPSLLEELSARHPDIKFTDGHMNPITLDGKLPPGMRMYAKMYGLLDKTDKKSDSINIWGSQVPLDKNGELFKLLSGHGVSTKEIAECRTFVEFQTMAESRLTLAVRPIVIEAAKNAEKRLGIPYVFLPVSYNFDEIEANYKRLFEALNLGEPNVETYKQQAIESMKAAKTAVGGRPIVIDSSSTCRPYTLARTLLEHGFNVEYVAAPECVPIEKSNYEWLKENSGIEFIDPTAPEAAKSPRNRADIISIGFEGAYYFGSEHIVPLVEDESLYGFHGLSKIMAMLTKAAGSSANLEGLISDYGFVI